MSQTTDPRRAAHDLRLRRLKVLAVGMSATVAVAFWSLVGGTIATAQPTTTTTDSTTTQPLVTNRGGSFFGGGQQRSLGGGGSLSGPMLRSGGS